MNTLNKKYRFIINPVSGEWKQTQKVIKEIKKKFSVQKIIEYEIKFTEKPGHATELAKEAVTEKFNAVIAVGGDGTMNETASALVNTNTALGILPRGSGNGYARSLNIPLKIKENLRRLMRPQIRTVDVGKINDYYFFGLCGIGFDAEIGAKFQQFGVRGPLPYFYLGLKEYFNYQDEECKIVSAEKTYKGKPLLITVANTPQYGLGAIINPGADYSDGKLEVCIIEQNNFFKLIFSLPKLFNGSIASLPFYKRFQTESLKITRSKKEGYFHTDGEPRIGGNELNIHIIKKALRVYV